MKNLTTFVLGCLSVVSVHAQYSEFNTYSNGLIYSETAMEKLSKVVDSRNLKFNSCDFTKEFRATDQTFGHLISLKSGDIAGAQHDLENKIPLEDFLKKYPDATIQRDILILRTQYKDYDEDDVVEIEHFSLTGNYGFSIKQKDLSLYTKSLAGQWLSNYTAKPEYSKESLTAFYFPQNFESKPLPQKYSKMIGYSDCLVDTNVTKFKKKTESGWVDLPENWNDLSQKEKEKLLDDMRGTRVVGGCSQDSRPREHAKHIALLSAETYNWEVFLRAHLDIMNDRFERMSDGSYALGARNTYIKELEELNINVPDLLMGISFRVENPANNHYYGSITRLGRALAETNNRETIEEAMVSAISDTELDCYNRLIIFYLYRNYLGYLDGESVDASRLKLETAVETFPEFIKNGLPKWEND